MATKLGLKKSDAFYERPDCGRLDGVIGKGTRFVKGQAAHNKGKAHPTRGRSAETQFKPGYRGGTALQKYKPIGTERISKDGYLERKINDDMPLQKRWRAVHLLLWESVNGPLPRGMAVVFLDGNKRNISLDNLELISRSDLMRRNTVHNLPPEIKEMVDLKRHLTRAIHQKEKEHEQNR